MARAAVIEAARVRAALFAGLGLSFALVFAFGAMFVAANRDPKWDLSYFRTAKPGDATRNIIRALQEPLEVSLFFPPANEVREQVAGLLRPAQGRVAVPADQELRPGGRRGEGEGAGGERQRLPRLLARRPQGAALAGDGAGERAFPAPQPGPGGTEADPPGGAGQADPLLRQRPRRARRRQRQAGRQARHHPGAAQLPPLPELRADRPGRLHRAGRRGAQERRGADDHRAHREDPPRGGGVHRGVRARRRPAAAGARPGGRGRTTRSCSSRSA